MRANFDKTQAVWIGARRGCGLELNTEQTIAWNHSGSFKLLGIKYSLAKPNLYLDNFTEKIEKVNRLLHDWSFKNLSLIGKITVIKTLALPMFVQCFTVLPDPPANIIKTIENIFFKFLWNGKPDKVKRNTLIGNYIDGGLKMPHITSFIHALKISWIKKILDPNKKSSWKILLTDLMEDLGGDKFWQYTKPALLQHAKKFNKFWHDVINSWALIQVNQSTTPEDILSQPLWYNDTIKIGNKPVVYSHWIKADIFFIVDLLKDDNTFLSFEEFQEKFRINNSNFLEFYSLLQAIPKIWKRTLLENITDRRHDGNKHITLMFSQQKVTKIFYDIFRQQTLEIPTSQKRWAVEMGYVIDENNWNCYYQIPFINFLNTKLQTFQYKIYHRFLYTNSLLLKCKLSETQLCSFCFETKETLSHFFFECTFVHNLWLQFAEKVQSKCTIPVIISLEICLFGTLCDDYRDILNTCFLIIRYYIYMCKLREEKPNLKQCLCILEFYKNLDMNSLYLCTPRQAENIRKKWEQIKELFKSGSQQD